MSVRLILSEVDKAKHPVATAIQKGKNFRTLAIAFKEGMHFKDHRVHKPTKLLVLSGRILYKQNEKQILLKKYDELDIPVNASHTIEATEDSLCLLLQNSDCE